MSNAATMRTMPRSGALPAFDLRALDGLRGLAALYIVAHHARIELWQGSQAALASGGIAAVVAVATAPLRYGAEVVLLFFLLSGFVIHLRAARSLAMGETPNFEIGSFFRRRVMRLAPPLLFALVLTAGLDAVGSLADASAYEAFASGRSAFVFAVNALFMQGFAAPTFGSNSALWSLSYEAIFYALYPALLVARVRFGARGAFGVVFGAGFLSCVLHVASPAIAWTVAPYFGVWALGALVAEMFASGGSVRAPAALVAAGALLMAPSLAAPGALDATVASAVFASGLALIMLVFVTHPAARVAAAQLARVRGLGARSYTLYVVHTPLLVCIGALWVRWVGARPGTGWLMPIGIVAAVALAYAVAPLLEFPFSRRVTWRSAGAVTLRKRRGASGMATTTDGWEVADERKAA